MLLAARPAVRFDEASLKGGACGVLAGVAFAGLAWAASGDLGTLRLTDLGPRLFPLLVMAGYDHGPVRHDHRSCARPGPAPRPEQIAIPQ